MSVTTDATLAVAVPRPGATAQLAEFAASFPTEDIPVAVLDTVERHLVDQLGIQLACSTLPWTKVIEDYAVRYGVTGPAVVVGSGRRLDSELAAMVNAASGHGFEMDDYGFGTMVHPGCIAVPTSLAVAEETGASGREFLAATVVGFEVILRLALATMPSMLVERGFHETGVHGVFGAAAAAARLQGLDVDRTLMALSLAGSHASGTCEYAQTGGQVKRFHAGIGASAGIRSARLAALGLTGPPTVLEGRRGVLQAFAPEPNVDALCDGLGERWAIQHHLSLKPYCCSGSIICLVDALDEITSQHRFAPTDIETIRVGASGHFLLHVGAVGPHPTDMQQAQFSAHYSLGLKAVTGGNGFAAYLAAEQAGFRQPDVIAVAERVVMEHDDEVEAALAADGSYLGKVTVVLRDGQEWTARAYGRGSGRRPLGAEEVEEKFRQNARAMSEDFDADRVLAAVHDLASASDVSALSKALSS